MIGGREREFINVFGMPGIGKSHLVELISNEYVDNNQGFALVANFTQSTIWDKNFRPVKLKEIPALKGKKGRFQYRNSDEAIFAPLFNATLKKMRPIKGLVVYDDAGSHEHGNFATKEIRQITSYYRQYCVDVIMIWHSMEEPAKHFYRKCSKIILFPTTTEPSAAYDKIPRIDEVRKAWHEVSDPYNKMADELEEKVKLGTLKLKPGQRIIDLIPNEIKHNFRIVNIRH